jgi:threonine dehydrogenase-like Zn-dependent dehydrogenase
MKGAVLRATRDIRFEERPDPTIEKPTDAVLRLAVTCVCGSDLWPYRGNPPVTEPRQWVTNIAGSSRRSGAM